MKFKSVCDKCRKLNHVNYVEDQKKYLCQNCKQDLEKKFQFLTQSDV